MAKERKNKEVRTHLTCVNIYDKFHDDFEEKYGIDLTYSQVTKKIAEKIISVGGIKV